MGAGSTFVLYLPQAYEPSRIDMGAPVAAQAFADPSDGFRHVRSSDAGIRALVRTGYDQSATFRALVDEIEANRVIVYVEPMVALRNE